MPVNQQVFCHLNALMNRVNKMLLKCESEMHNYPAFITFGSHSKKYVFLLEHIMSNSLFNLGSGEYKSVWHR